MTKAQTKRWDAGFKATMRIHSALVQARMKGDAALVDELEKELDRLTA